LSDNTYVANNTVFNNGLDPWGGPGIWDNIGGTTTVHNFYYNNISVSCTTAVQATAPSHAGNSTYWLSPNGGANPATNNISFFVTNSANCKTTGHNSFVPSNGEWVFEGGQPNPTSTNKLSTNPLWVNVSFSSPGTQTTTPASTNFALTATSPAIGYGITSPGAWLPATSVDAGACYHTLTTCP
jgi:hypothetical protein